MRFNEAKICQIQYMGVRQYAALVSFSRKTGIFNSVHSGRIIGVEMFSFCFSKALNGLKKFRLIYEHGFLRGLHRPNDLSHKCDASNVALILTLNSLLLFLSQNRRGL